MVRIVVTISTLALLVGACPSAPPPAEPSPSAGTEGAACYPNGTCNDGLACKSNVCVAASNPSTAVRVHALASTDDCPNGGQQVDTGIDENGNGVLDDDEVDQSVILCNGTDGTNGTNGTDGDDCTVVDGPGVGEHTITCGDTSVVVQDGADGANGADGDDGAPGTSCTVADGPAAGEHTITCGDTSVVVQDGTNGADAVPCSVVDGPNAGEHTVTCGSTSVVIVDGVDGADGAPGSSCTVANGPGAGEHTISCGGSSVVVQDGTDGADAVPCSVVDGPNAGEHTVTCGATSVVIVDGADGADGAPGSSCTVANGPGVGEHTITCGDTSVVVQDGTDGADGADGADGTSCTVSDGPGAGEHTITCGGTSVVVQDGTDGADAVPCSVVDGPSAGEHTVTCGATSVVIHDGGLFACGDGLCTGSEGCDDGNTTNGDGCSSACVVEDGFVCSGGGPGSCSHVPSPALAIASGSASASTATLAALTSSSTWTVEFWLFVNSSTEGGILGQGTGFDFNDGFQFALGSSTLAGQIKGPNNICGYGVSFPRSSLVSGWSHVALVFDGIPRLFVNGTSASSTANQGCNGSSEPVDSLAFQYAPAAAPFTVGKYVSYMSAALVSVDEVRISNIARYDSNFLPEFLLRADADSLLVFPFDEAGSDFTDTAGGVHLSVSSSFQRTLRD